MKKYIALLTALSILAANGTTAVSAVSETSDGNSETVSVSESEKKECLVSIILTDIYKYNSDFLDYSTIPSEFPQYCATYRRNTSVQGAWGPVFQTICWAVSPARLTGRLFSP